MGTRLDKQNAIADQLRRTPTRSNSWIGREVGASPHTVKRVRSSLEGRGILAAHVTRIGGDGRRRAVASTDLADALRWLEDDAPATWFQERLIWRPDEDRNFDFLSLTKMPPAVIVMLPPDDELEPFILKGRSLTYHFACLVRLDCLGRVPVLPEPNLCNLVRVVVLRNTDVAWLVFEIGANRPPTFEVVEVT